MVVSCLTRQPKREEKDKARDSESLRFSYLEPLICLSYYQFLSRRRKVSRFSHYSSSDLIWSRATGFCLWLDWQPKYHLFELLFFYLGADSYFASLGAKTTIWKRDLAGLVGRESENETWLERERERKGWKKVYLSAQWKMKREALLNKESLLPSLTWLLSHAKTSNKLIELQNQPNFHLASIHICSLSLSLSHSAKQQQAKQGGKRRSEWSINGA